MQVLDDWRNQPLDEIFYSVRELVQDPEFPTVKCWRAAGGKGLGHFQVYSPEEIAHAAEMLPVQVRGASVKGRQADSRFGSYFRSGSPFPFRSNTSIVIGFPKALVGRSAIPACTTNPR